MSSKASNPSGSCSKNQHSSTSRSQSKTDDWADISDPEERRRIQNRLAQRKFRKKNQESKEKAVRDAHNKANAQNAYTITSPLAVAAGEKESGLPWGSININHVIARGHDHESRHGSGREAHAREEPYYTTGYAATFTGGYQQPTSYGSNGSEERYYARESPVFYDYDGSGYMNQGQMRQ